MTEINEEELMEWHLNYGTPDSLLLKEVKDAGFNPIAITIIQCEETFVFKGNAEAKEAADKFLPEGWWYGLSDFHRDYEKHCHDNYDGDLEMGPHIYWLDRNFEPKD